MAWIRTVAAEVLGLFVDDGPFAACIVLWIVAAWLVLPRLGLSSVVDGLVLVAGLAAILVDSALRRARRR